ncbi:MAG: hypothetical protein AB8F94_24455 [Saprospiraceae bacterium]
MSQSNTIESTHITTHLVPANESTELKWLMLFICTAYHYKLIFCGFFGKVLGYSWICNTMIHGVSTNHWFEQLVYAPLLWYVMYRIIIVVFGPHHREVLGKSVQTKKVLALFFATIHIYALGIHFTNTIEIYSRVHLDISSGPLYEQIFWVDEVLSHWIQFFFYFLFFAWLITYDRLDREDGGKIAIFTGLLHGLERSIGVIEGDNPYSALVFGTWILIACLIRWKNHKKDFTRVWKDFFFRYGLTFGISMPIGLLSYHLTFDGFIQPSTMKDSAWEVVVFGAVFILVGFFMAIGIDSFLSKKSKPSK